MNSNKKTWHNLEMPLNNLFGIKDYMTQQGRQGREIKKNDAINELIAKGLESAGIELTKIPA